MKRKIFTLGLLSLAFSANAQSLLGVQDQASLHIKEDALIYSGGELKTVENGVIDNFGNVMMLVVVLKLLLHRILIKQVVGTLSFAFGQMQQQMVALLMVGLLLNMVNFILTIKLHKPKSQGL